MPAPEVLGGLILKLLGSVSGTVLALIFQPPRNWRDFQRRGAFSVIAGVSLTPITILVMRQFFDVATDAETIVAVATITAFASWWAAGAVIRMIRAWQGPKPEE